MSTPHNSANKGDIAERILLPGDPLRAEFIANNFLTGVKKFNSVRNMFGFTGDYKGKKVSVMGTGMGIPSIALYTYELIHMYGVKNLIRVGSCGSFSKDIGLQDIILAMGSSSNSNFAAQFNLNGHLSAIASYELLEKAKKYSDEKGYNVRVGNVYSSDIFYNDDPEDWKQWQKMGILGVEMESYGLYLNAMRAGVNALTILTVSDSLVTGEEISAEARQTSFTKMMEIALETV